MMSKRPDELTISSMDALRDVELCVFTTAAGPFGRIVGRALRLEARRFTFTLGRTPEAQAASKDASGVFNVLTAAPLVTQQRNAPPMSLRRVDVLADSLVAVAEVDKRRFDLTPLTDQEADKVNTRTRHIVLDAPLHPVIRFEVEREYADHIDGALTLRGERREVRCDKILEPGRLVVRCPVNTSAFGIPAYGHLRGMFRVGDTVMVEARVPTKLFQ